MSLDGSINLDLLAKMLPDAAADGLEQATNDRFATSQDLVPVLDGDLKRSGRVEVDRAALVGTITYDTDYAVIVHEKDELRHTKGSSKYLELPLVGDRDKTLKTIAESIRRQIGFR